jgi:hypothetical protein
MTNIPEAHADALLRSLAIVSLGALGTPGVDSAPEDVKRAMEAVAGLGFSSAATAEEHGRAVTSLNAGELRFPDSLAEAASGLPDALRKHVAVHAHRMFDAGSEPMPREHALQVVAVLRALDRDPAWYREALQMSDAAGLATERPAASPSPSTPAADGRSKADVLTQADATVDPERNKLRAWLSERGPAKKQGDNMFRLEDDGLIVFVRAAPNVLRLFAVFRRPTDVAGSDLLEACHGFSARSLFAKAYVDGTEDSGGIVFEYVLHNVDGISKQTFLATYDAWKQEILSDSPLLRLL